MRHKLISGLRRLHGFVDMTFITFIDLAFRAFDVVALLPRLPLAVCEPALPTLRVVNAPLHFFRVRVATAIATGVDKANHRTLACGGVGLCHQRRF